MSLRPRQGEVRAVAGLLEDEHDSVDELAGEVIRKCFDLLMQRELWLVLLVYPDALWTHGPYFTRRQAEKALLDTAVAPHHDQARVLIRRLITSTADGGE